MTDENKDKDLAKEVAKEIREQVLHEFYETVGKSVIKKLAGLLLVAIGAGVVALMVKLGMLKV